MKRILFSLLLLAATTAYAQGIDSIFVSSPVSELKLIAPNARLDMIDLMAYKMEARGENVYGGYSLLMERSERHLKVRLSEASTWELQLLRQGPDTLYACIYTLFAPAAESRVSLLTTSWKPAAAPAVPAPAYADFHASSRYVGC